MLTEEKNEKITKYILEQVEILNKEYENIVSKDCGSDKVNVNNIDNGYLCPVIHP